MRLKEFIIFIIIFTIIYILFFVIYDYFANKKSIEKGNIQKDGLFDLNKYAKFANFYQITPTITEIALRGLAEDLKNNLIINITPIAEKNNITKDELIIVILYLEYVGLIRKRAIIYDNDCTAPLNDGEQNLIVKYSLYFSNKYDYRTIIQNVGINSDKEIDYLNRRYLLPGIRIDNSIVSYVGDLDE